MSLNQRFKSAFDYLKVNGFVKNQITFYETLGMDKGRFSYLYRSDEAKEIKAEEIKALQANYPQINWINYVALGVGPMLAGEDTGMVNEPEPEYNSKHWHQEQLNLIVAGMSKLPESEQLKILRSAYVERNNENIEIKGHIIQLKEQVIQLQKAGQSSLLHEIKNILKGK